LLHAPPEIPESRLTLSPPHHSEQAVPPCDLITEPQPLSGQRNMAVDAALLKCAAESRRSVVRIYRWSEATVSLGYFQKDRTEIPRSLSGLPVVQRLSGGGAILHHHEITYSCVLPPTHPVRHRPYELYQIVHQAIMACLQRQGIDCILRSEQPPVQDTGSVVPDKQTFLCFLRQDGNDIVVSSGQKVVGSAQRRRRGTILQHGSILLSRSPWADSIPGLSDISPAFSSDQLMGVLPLAIANAISSDVAERQLTSLESSTADQIESEIHGQSGSKLVSDSSVGQVATGDSRQSQSTN